ncbi:MAG: hypothetical protein QNJ68_08780 [Microcoleaceae cyanobacterium MO_207.B10]|nr:hypothetical protein [Microcoleaceae cyanobacterium MO_207.B10]
MSTNNQLSSTYSKASYPKKSEKIVGNKRKYLRFNWIFFLSVFITVVAAGGFNVVIDPYDVFNTPNLLGINHSKPRKDNSDRLFKATDIIRIKPITILIGSSRTKQGLDPNHPALENDQPAYNLSLDGLNTYELGRYIEHAVTNQKELDLIILGLDFFMFNTFLENRPSFSENRLEKQNISLVDFVNVTFSSDALLASKETIVDSQKNPPDNIGYGENGFIPYRNPDPEKTQWRFENSINLYYRFPKYQLPAQLTELIKIVDLCQQNQIKLISFISPSHATQWEAIRAKGEWSTFEEWKRKVVQITPVFDFSGYNSITSEPIHNEMENYRDNSHYTKKIGDLVLNRILSYKKEEVPEDFGILINPENVESHLVKIRQDREIWAKNNPDEVQLVKEIKQKYDAKLAEKTR